VPDHILGWVDIVIEQYLALPSNQQRLIDTRIQQLLTDPAGSDTHRDPDTDLWTTTDAAGSGLIVYIFRADKPRLVIMRLVY